MEAGRRIIGKKIPNFVRCRADFLPFKNDSFAVRIMKKVHKYEPIVDTQVMT
jgi:hypothetical protein